MSTNKSVTVLIPNGRRQNVKITPNTTILQIIEDVCKKHGFDVDGYDLKHYNKVLDPNMIFRFTGLPNNAQLEMVPCTKARKVSDVTVGIQLTSGERSIGDFPATASLLEVLQKLCPTESLETAVIIYMHREVQGKKSFEDTSLKSLGLNSGRAMLRLIHRDPTQLIEQAHVSAPLLSKSVKDDDQSPKRHDTYRPSAGSYSNKILDPVTLMKKTKTMLDQPSTSKNVPDAKGVEKMDVSSESEKPHCSQEVDNSSSSAQHTPQTTESDVGPMEEDIQIDFLGERNALIFNQAGAQALPRDELPDNFFDITIDDAKALLRDAKRLREELENAPLLTDAQRKLERNKRTLNQLHKYRRTVIRVQFPDQYVLQGLFGPLETVQDIKNFIKEYLENPSSEFTIYTAPPKYVLNPESRLIDENLVPSAIMYYSGSSVIKQSIKERVTDPKAAGIQAIKSRMAVIRQDLEMEKSETGASDDNRTISGAGTSKISKGNALQSN